MFIYIFHNLDFFINIYLFIEEFRIKDTLKFNLKDIFLVMQKNNTLWQLRINIIQSPKPFKPERIPDDSIPFYQKPESIRSFLYDPFGDNPPSIYGLELTANQNINVVFFTKVESEIEGYKLGHAWLSNLKYKFIGLDGHIEVKQIQNNQKQENENYRIFEIVLPSGLIRNKINIIERFVNFFFYKKKQTLKFIILWRRQSQSKDSEEQNNSYYLKIYAIYDARNLSEKDHLRIFSVLKFLSMDIENHKGERAYIKPSLEISQLNLRKGEVFDDMDDDLRIFTIEDVNFDFPEDIPLPSIPILEKENVRYIDLDKEFIRESIGIGNHIKKAIITNHVTYIPINKLSQDLCIFGKSGSGKTYFLAKIIEEIRIKAKKVGILVVNVAKESQEIYYRNFRQIKYTDDEFRIPYFIEGSSQEKSLQETATYICASLGLKNVYEKIIYRTGMGLKALNGNLPEFFISLLKSVEKYMENNPYGSEAQANLIQALRNRINVFNDEKVQNVLKLTESLPKWVLEWINGNKIFLDLSMCNKYTKMFIVNAIFQLIRTITKDSEYEELKYLIVIDEAHAILEKPITRNSDDADFIMKEQMAKIFSELLKEYRSRGVGFIIVDQSPSRLFDDVASQPSIKILFRQDHPNNLLFTEDPSERQILTELPNRLALVINGATGEKYLIKTIDYNLKKE